MKNFNDFIREKGLILVVILVMGGIIFVKYSDKKSKNLREELKLKGSFAIGEFTDRSYYSSNGMVNCIGFSFAIGSKKIRGVDNKCGWDSQEAGNAFIDKKMADVGNKFLVLYDLKNPKKSIIRLDYPIKDSSDFKRYVKEFEEMRVNK
jgi:hypothetical protein